MNRKGPIISTLATIGIVSIIVAVAGTALITTSNIADNGGPLMRAVSQRAVRVGQPVTVTLDLSMKPLVSSCQALAARPMDILLLLDRSGSMDGSPVQQAIEAARRFIETVDLPTHRIGILLFADSPSWVKELTSDRAVLLQILGPQRGSGGTAIGLALQEASAVLNSVAKRPEAAGVVILLSDGGAGDPDLTESTAEFIKTAGGHIVVIALPGSDFDEDLLKRVATSPSDYWTVARPADLEALYSSLAEEINRAVATDATVTEPYNRHAFDLDTVETGIEAEDTGEELVWRFALLTDEGRDISYVLRPRRLGWPSVTMGIGEASMRDCRNNPRSWDAPLGPRVLVYPSPYWLLLFLIPLLLPWAWPWLGLLLRRPGRKPRAAGEMPPSPDQRPPRQLHTPPSFEWAETIEKLVAEDAGTEVPPFTPTLIIGVGRAGRWVLTHVKKNLKDRCGSEMPESVRLLAVDVEVGVDMLPGISHPSQAALEGEISVGDTKLDRDEQVSLSPNLAEVDRALQEHPERFQYMRWWHESGGDEGGRALGRVALFYDLLHGTGNSKFWNALSQQMQGLDNPRIFIIGSLTEEIASGLVLDLPHLVRAVIRPRPISRVALFLGTRAILPEEGRVKPGEFAALRELQRLMLKQPFPYQYSPPAGGRELAGSTVTTPIDACYLLDGTGLASYETEAHMYGTQNQAMRTDWPPVPLAIADALTTLIDPKVAPEFDNWVSSMLTEAGRVENDKGEPVVSSLGSFVYRLPVYDIRRAAELRFLLNVLFGEFDTSGRVGIVRVKKSDGVVVLDRDADQQDEPNLDKAVLTFLQGTHLHNRHAFSAAIATALERREWDEAKLPVFAEEAPLARETFLWSLQEQLISILNGEREDYVANRSGKLGYCLAFLEKLKSKLQEGERLAKRAVRTFRDREKASALLDRIQGYCRLVEDTLKEMQGWEELLVGAPPEEEPSLPHVWQTPASSSERETLYNQLKVEWERAQENLRLMAGVPVREMFLDEHLEKPFYERHLGEMVSGGVGLSPLGRAMQGLGWWSEVEGGRLRLKMLVLPASFDGKISQPRQYALSRDDLDRVREILLELAHALSRSLLDERVNTFLQRHGATTVADTVAQATEPLILYDKTMAGDIVSSQEQLYLALENEDFGRVVRNQFGAKLADLKANTRVLGTEDPYGCAAVRIRDLLPMRMLGIYQASEVEYYKGSKLWHVFPAEQAAIELESRASTEWGETYHYHPRFVRLLETESLAQLFGQCYVYGLIRAEDFTGGRRWVLDTGGTALDLTIISGRVPTLFEAAEAFAANLPMTEVGDHPLRQRNLSQTMESLKQALEARRKERKDWTKHLEALEKEARALRTSERPWERDMGALLEVLIQDEMLSMSGGTS